MSKYQITPRVLQLVTDLFNEGYQGTSEITKSYCTGTKEVLGDAGSVQITGFCKESLHIVEDVETNEIVLVGRYEEEDRSKEGYTVEDIVRKAYYFFQVYQPRGYGEPLEFQKLFEKYGLVKVKTVTKTERVYL